MQKTQTETERLVTALTDALAAIDEATSALEGANANASAAWRAYRILLRSSAVDTTSSEAAYSSERERQHNWAIARLADAQRYFKETK